MSPTVPVGIVSLDDLDDQSSLQYGEDLAFKAQVDKTISDNKARKRSVEPQLGSAVRSSVPKSGLVEAGTTKQLSGVKVRPLRSSAFPGATAVDLMEVIAASTATKVRDMSEATRNLKFNELCDKLEVPEPVQHRMAFYFSFIAWITLNTASTENSQESDIGGYPSLEVLKFFNYDIRPMARAMAEDAKMYITEVAQNASHELSEKFNDLARAHSVPKMPYLIYDGIDAARLTAYEIKLAESIKLQRLNAGVNLNMDAQVARRLLAGQPAANRVSN